MIWANAVNKSGPKLLHNYETDKIIKNILLHVIVADDDFTDSTEAVLRFSLSAECPKKPQADGVIKS